MGPGCPNSNTNVLGPIKKSSIPVSVYIFVCFAVVVYRHDEKLLSYGYAMRLCDRRGLPISPPVVVLGQKSMFQ